MNLTRIVKQLWAEDGPMIAAGEDVADGLRHLCARCYEVLPLGMWKDLSGMASDAGDEHEFQTWLADTLSDFPPPADIRMFWFGIVEDYGVEELTDEAGADGESDDHSPEVESLNPGSEESFVWLGDENAEQAPEGETLFPAAAFVYLCGDRYLFTEQRPAERQKGFYYDPPGQQFYSRFVEMYYQTYFGEDDAADQLAVSYLIPAYLGLLITRAFRSIDPGLLLGPSALRQVVFGWDDGEPIVLGDMARDGWKPRYTPVRF
ncbi:MAG: hypothetical protein Kow0059_00960 [Candidatus Sumerlaeia bacterium]